MSDQPVVYSDGFILVEKGGGKRHKKQRIAVEKDANRTIKSRVDVLPSRLSKRTDTNTFPYNSAVLKELPKKKRAPRLSYKKNNGGKLKAFTTFSPSSMDRPSEIVLRIRGGGVDDEDSDKETEEAIDAAVGASVSVLPSTFLSPSNTNGAETIATAVITSTPITTPERRYLSEEPTRQDVLCGRGYGNVNHPGNMAFQQIIRDHTTEYETATEQNVKSKILKKVLQHVHNSQRRILKHDVDIDQWYEISHTHAHRKIGHCLRDTIRNTRSTPRQPKQKKTNNSTPIQDTNAFALLQMQSTENVAEAETEKSSVATSVAVPTTCTNTTTPIAAELTTNNVVTAKSKDSNVDNLDDDVCKQNRIAGTGGLLFPNLPDGSQADDDLDDDDHPRIIKGTAPKRNDRDQPNNYIDTTSSTDTRKRSSGGGNYKNDDEAFPNSTYRVLANEAALVADRAVGAVVRGSVPTAMGGVAAVAVDNDGDTTKSDDDQEIVSVCVCVCVCVCDNNKYNSIIPLF